jgi:cytochrome b6-f complex iron-sulfur subunit
MATISEMSGDDREQRIAELKRKMQENAKRVKAEHDAKEESTEAAVTAEATAPVAVAEAEAAPTAEPVAAVAAPAAAAAEERPATNGAAAPSAAAAATPAAPPATAPVIATPVEEVVDDGQAALTRREFLTYAWGAAMALLAVETGLVSYFFMYPRFRAGEFGGKFFLSLTDVPSLDAAPVPETSGKFWLVDTEDEGPKALYMVCTHLGCLYKWEASNNRFECPCHGSKFSKDGFYIEGPAPRSLDRFEITEENGQVVVDTGAKIVGNPATESPARAVVA